ncbi:MAG: SDR family oxidoreductase [Streptosporangiaceae bacterium]|jgi:NAD(P)-dependent dehydrogenase (short-subunit alcohol dehydrogenase family)
MTAPGTGAAVAPSALITGATGGIGRAIAGRLARAGYRLTLSGRDEAALGKLAGDLAGSGAEPQVTPADMSSEDDIRALARSHAGRFGSLDLLVLSAGTGTSGRIADYPMRHFDRQMTVNVRAPFALVQECLPALRRAAAARPAHGARITAIASMTGIASEPGLAAYGAAKAALISLCQSVNAEESSAGITATAIAPGYVDTEMSAWVHDRIDPAQMIPPGDIAELVLALAQLSARSVIPLIAMSRAGETHWQA